MNERDSVFVAGHHGLVGSAVVRELVRRGFQNLVVRSREQLDLRDQAAVAKFFEEVRPQYVVLAAARVGGIRANDAFPAEFIRDNLLIQSNVIDSAWRCGARKLCFLGSSCAYPKFAPQPIREDSLLAGPLEPTNASYAVAKIAGITMCRAYRRQYGFNAISLMPTNLYGPGDEFDLEQSHVVPALMRRCHDSKVRGDDILTVWGTGRPRREFLYVDDLARAIVHLMCRYDGEDLLNVGTGTDISIRDLAELICEIVGFNGRLKFDASRPDGTPRKLLNVDRALALGWRPTIELGNGLRATYEWFLSNQARVGVGGAPS